MDDNQTNYVRSLVRMDIRKKEKQIERLAPKPGQTDQDVASIKRNLLRNLEFRVRVLNTLKGRGHPAAET